MQPTKSEFNALIELINGTRIAQGWAVLPSDEVLPIVSSWFQLLKNQGIEADQYPKLLSKAVEYRTAEIREKKRPTPFSIELLLAMATPKPFDYNAYYASMRQNPTAN